MTVRRTVLLLTILAALAAPPAAATPVCTDGYKGGPPAALCGGRIFPEATGSIAYIQHTPDATGFSEYRDGIAYMAQKYPRWVSTFTLSSRFGKDAVSAGDDGKRAGEPGDGGDGRQIDVIRLTDHNVPDAGKRTLFFSLSIHGNERGGLEGGVRTAEDLAIAAVNGGKIADGVDNYESTTGRKPTFSSYEVRDLLAQEIVYLVDFNADGWAVGDLTRIPTSLFTRGNSLGTDLNRQMPTVGRIDRDRNPLQENEMRFGEQLLRAVAKEGRGGLMDYGADVHGELTSQAFMDIMYPAGQFDSVQHRRHMAIAERTKSVIDATLYGGIVDLIESVDGGNEQEGSLATPGIPTKPAHWATVWDTLGYTDTGFLGDYIATETAVTGMDYEIFLNHTVPDKVWTVLLQENHINATRGIIKTAMAYALSSQDEFNAGNVAVDPVGRAGYVIDPNPVTDRDANGPGTLPGPAKDGTGADGSKVAQRAYEATNQKWFTDTTKLMGAKPFVGLASADIAARGATLDALDTLVLADVAQPADARGRAVDRARYFAAIGAWVRRGGNLVLTDKALHALADLGVVKADAVRDIGVYQPYANMRALNHPLLAGLRPNARQLVEAPILGYEIGNAASPMTVVTSTAWRAAGGTVVGTTGPGDGATDDSALTSIGELALGDGSIRIVGGALPSPTEANDHRYGLRDYALTYTGLYILENAIKHDVPGLGNPSQQPKPYVCVSRRRFEIRIPRAKASQRRRYRVTVAGRRVGVRAKRGRVVATVDMRRVSGKKTVVVRITRRAANGKWRLVSTRRYRTCTPRKGGSTGQAP